MSLITVLLLGLSLSMDAFAASICEGLALKKVTWKEMTTVGAWFGIFQGLMPFLGWLAGMIFAQWVSGFSGWIALVLLGFLGIRMIREAVHGDEEVASGFSLKASVMFTLAIATSIDALAARITFSVVPVTLVPGSAMLNTFLACIIICAETWILSMIGVKVGSVAGDKLGKPAQIAGGVVLVLLGIKILLQGYGIL